MEPFELLSVTAILESQLANSNSFLCHIVNKEYSPDKFNIIETDNATEPSMLQLIADFGRIVDHIPNSRVFDDGNTLGGLYNTYNDIIRYATLETSNSDLEMSSFDSRNKDTYEQYAERFSVERRRLIKLQNRDPLMNEVETLAQYNKVKKAKKEWIVNGKKLEFESELFDYVKNKYTTSQAMFYRWYNNISEMDEKTDLNLNIYPSYDLQPANKWSSSGRIRNSSLKKFWKKLPDQIRNKYPIEILNEIYDFSFQYKVIRVDRRWFEPQLFKHNNWSLDESWPFDEKVVSNGKPYLTGICPAYIKSVVIIKDIKFEFKKSFLDAVIYEFSAGMDLLGKPLFAILPSFLKDTEENRDTINRNYTLSSFVCNYIPQSPKS